MASIVASMRLGQVQCGWDSDQGSQYIRSADPLNNASLPPECALDKGLCRPQASCQPDHWAVKKVC